MSRYYALLAVVAPLAAAGAIGFGVAAFRANEPDPGQQSDMPNFGEAFYIIVLEGLTGACIAVATLSLVGGILLVAVNKKRVAPLRTLAGLQEPEQSEFYKDNEFKMSLVPFFGKEGSAGVGLVGSF